MAAKRLSIAEQMLEVQGRRERWGKLRAQLTGRRCLLAASLANLYSLGPQAGAQFAFPANLVALKRTGGEDLVQI